MHVHSTSSAHFNAFAPFRIICSWHLLEHDVHPLQSRARTMDDHRLLWSKLSKGAANDLTPEKSECVTCIFAILRLHIIFTCVSVQHIQLCSQHGGQRRDDANLTSSWMFCMQASVCARHSFMMASVLACVRYS